MATIQDKETFGRARLSFAQESDVDEFVSMLARFEAGEIGPDEWRGFRLLRGTYGQRQNADAQMLRVKIPQGILDASQLEVLAGIPTVVFGYFALLFVTPLLQEIGIHVGTFSALSAGIVVGVLLIPTVASISEDAMSSVPGDLRAGAYALGSTRYEVSTRIVVPAAISGIVASFGPICCLPAAWWLGPAPPCSAFGWSISAAARRHRWGSRPAASSLAAASSARPA